MVYLLQHVIGILQLLLPLNGHPGHCAPLVLQGGVARVVATNLVQAHVAAMAHTD